MTSLEGRGSQNTSWGARTKTWNMSIMCHGADTEQAPIHIHLKCFILMSQRARERKSGEGGTKERSKKWRMRVSNGIKEKENWDWRKCESDRKLRLIYSREKGWQRVKQKRRETEEKLTGARSFKKERERKRWDSEKFVSWREGEKRWRDRT